ncbi:hypothetical protein L1F06_015670 [Ectopseudomonas hydrolytica]|uniref:Transposase n=1 Tax=Ectopseudomonas hydrolytica TaxID=2493633 RepID=A0ABY5A2K2_9GAMM|nr:hypothetical protein [Pseudomonas hydrolytica]USR38109.1 hypothetical protein L1F06_015670 [Pseudomonas hydrolytica]
MNRPALRAHLRAKVNRAVKRLRELHAMRDWEGIKLALQAYWQAANAWRAVL